MSVRLGLLVTSLAGLLTALGMSVPDFTAIEYSSSTYATTTDTSEVDTQSKEKATVPDTRAVVQHQPLPEQVKAIYMTSCVVGTPTFRQRLVDLIHETEINSVIIDIKDFSGTISFPPENNAWKPSWQKAQCGAHDMREFVAALHGMGVFVIGRITVFQDPFYTATHPEYAVKRADGVSIWKDYKGLSFIDVGAQPYWDHLTALAVDAYNIGFDELNFDYVRYPSDGPMRDISFTLSEKYPNDDDQQANLEAFFKYLSEALDDEVKFATYRHTNTGRASSTPWTSVDLFGMTTTNFDDLSIGQVQDRAAPYFDFIAPMVYPSHYPNSFLGLGNPNDYPYKVVYHAMKTGVDRMTASTTPMQGFLHTPQYTVNASGIKTFTGQYQKPVYGADKFRTWIQDFDYGGDYDAADVRAQIQASYDAGVMDFMIWAPSNIYTKAALKGAGHLEIARTESEVGVE